MSRSWSAPAVDRGAEAATGARRLLGSTLAVLMVGVLAVVPTAAPAAAVTRGAVTGHVVLPPGVVLPVGVELEVVIERDGADHYRTTVGRDDLSFAFPDLAQDEYHLRVSGSDEVAGGYHLGDRTAWRPAEAQVVVPGDDVSVVLDPAVAVTGTIVLPDAMIREWTDPRIHAFVVRPDGRRQDVASAEVAWVDDELTYRIAGLRDGESYQLSVHDWENFFTDGYLTNLETGELDWRFGAARAEVVAPATLDLVPHVEPYTGGWIRVPDGITAASTALKLFVTSDGKHHHPVTTAMHPTDASLRSFYTMLNPDVPYALMINDSSGVVAAGYLSNGGWVADHDLATPLEPGGALRMLDAPRGAPLVGTVVPPAGFAGELSGTYVRVRAGGTQVRTLRPESDGAFVFPGLLPGADYDIELLDVSNYLVGGFLTADGSLRADRSSATRLRVPGEPVVMRAAETGRMTVVLTRRDGDDSSPVDLTVLDRDHRFVSSVTIDDGSTAELHGLLPGADYRLYVEGPRPLVEGYYAGEGMSLAERSSEAVPVRAGDSVSVALEDLFALTPVVVLPSGYCTGPDSDLRISYMRLGPQGWSQSLATHVMEDDGSIYGFGNLRPGTYLLHVGSLNGGIEAGAVRPDGTLSADWGEAALLDGPATVIVRPQMASGWTELIRPVGEPVVHGDAVVGSTLTAVPASWSRPTRKVEYQWLRNGTPIAGAQAAAYTLAGVDAGASVAVRVTGHAQGCAPSPSTSAGSPEIVPGTVTNLEPPAVTGAPRVGSTLTATAGTWSLPGLTYGYQWLRNGSPIVGAGGHRYSPTLSDLGAQLSVQVTTSGTGTVPARADSALTGTVGEGSIERTTAPTVSGTAKVGSILKAAPGTWSVPGLTYRYQWLRDGSAITGGARATYTAVPADAGRRISVRVTAARTGYVSTTAVSATTGAVAKGSIVGTRRPTVSGTAKVGARLRATPGSWSVPGLTYRYQWLRNGSAIPSASGSTYSVRSADAGKKVSVRVTVSRTGYSPASVASPATRRVIRGPIANRTRPSISGAARVGRTITTSGGRWSVPGVTYRYQWLRNGSPIPWASGPAYSVRSADVGKRISVRVTVTRTDHSPGVATSLSTPSVRR